MIEYEKMRTKIAKGMKEYVKCPVIRSNQTGDRPDYPYISYTVTTLAGQNNGTYSEYEDGTARKPVPSIWSFTCLSDDNSESVSLANKARDWLDFAGTEYLNENEIIVQSVGAIRNRDNILTAEYEYKNGFDCTFSCVDEIEREITMIENAGFNVQEQ